MVRALFLAGFMSFVGATMAAPLPPSDQRDLVTRIDQHERLLVNTSRAIWNFAELGYLETRSSSLLQAELRKAGFKVTAHVAGMPTAFVASFNNGPGPVLATLAEYDALPGLSQTTEPVKNPVPGQHNGHACGHNLFGAAAITTAIAVKDWMVRNQVSGELRVYGTPAEEGGSGKVYMVREGLFDDVAAVVVWHPWDRNEVTVSRSQAVINARVRFYGSRSPSATMPENGISALDGLEVMNVAANYLRGRIPHGTSLYYSIVSGGGASSIVPDVAEARYYIRNLNPEVVRSVWERVIKAGEGAAAASGTKFEAEIIGAVYPTLGNETLGQVMDRHFRHVGGVQLTPEETRWAQTIQKTLPEQKPLGSMAEIRPIDRPDRRGASDVGDVSWVTPTITVVTATWVPGTPAHDWQATAASGMSIGFKGGMVAAKVMALTLGELFKSPETLAAAKAELAKAQGPDFKYEALLGSRPPALDYQKQ